MWICRKCHIIVPMKQDEFPIRCRCGFIETYEEATNRGIKFSQDNKKINNKCQNLGGVKESFNGKILSCGCSRIYLYPCSYFNELVTLHTIRHPNKIDTADDVRNGIKDFHPEYNGKACQGCRFFKVKQEDNTEKKENNSDFNAELHIKKYPYHPTNKKLAAITCHFNPQESKSRLECLSTFSRQFPKIGMDLYIGEGSSNNHWEIPLGDKIYRFDLDSESHLFAKENLLNLVIDRLPDYIERVLWIDSDVILLAEDYTDQVNSALDKYTVVQGFKQLRYQGKNNDWETGWRSSIGYVNIVNGTKVAEPKRAYPGLAWATSRETLIKIGGIYDKVINGGGDVAWCCGIYGDLQPEYSQLWSEPLVSEVRQWATNSIKHISTVGYVKSNGIHLYHGNLKNRQYVQRNKMLRDFDFDPKIHLEYADNGTLRWSKNVPPQFKLELKEYIFSKKEDD